MTTNETKTMKVLQSLKENLRITWADGGGDVIESQYSMILERQVPFFLAAAKRRRKAAGRTDAITQVVIGLGLQYCHREWDVASKTWCAVRDTECHDCGQPKQRRKADVMGRVWNWQTLTYSDEELLCRNQYQRHICTPRKEPVEGTTYAATFRAGSGVSGLIGSYSIEWRDNLGNLIGGLISSKAACVDQLRIWGFSGRIVWASK